MEKVIKDLLIDFCQEVGVDYQDPIVREKIQNLTEDLLGLIDPPVFI